jgi:hypothetical protein
MRPIMEHLLRLLHFNSLLAAMSCFAYETCCCGLPADHHKRPSNNPPKSSCK